jgi:Asp-tRNA(Asn)/Glu-tRNA(Gln) amidotransferase A subunit family amidase
MDKLGPICRSLEDCAIVLDAMYRPEGQDPSVNNASFNWDARMDWKRLRVGYLRADFEPKPKAAPPKTAETTSWIPEEQIKREEQKKRRELRMHVKQTITTTAKRRLRG